MKNITRTGTGKETITDTDIVCEGRFYDPGKKNSADPTVSYDYHIIYNRCQDEEMLDDVTGEIETIMADHSLIIRKNLKDNKFEVLRTFQYTEAPVTITEDGRLIVGEEPPKEVVAFSGSFDEVLKFASKEHTKRWGSVSIEDIDEYHKGVEITYRYEYIACKHSGRTDVDRDDECDVKDSTGRYGEVWERIIRQEKEAERRGEAVVKEGGSRVREKIIRDEEEEAMRRREIGGNDDLK